MKKIAIFVEGHTESKFVERLVTEILNKNALKVECLELSGPIANRSIKVVKANTSTDEFSHYIMIYNCTCDSAVKSDIKQQYATLMKASYSAVIGLRDVYPTTDIVRLRNYASYGLPTPSPVTPEIVLAVMEVESWFLAEELHYEKIHRNLNKSHGDAAAGFDISKKSTESILQPSAVLHKIYTNVGFAYKKKEKQIQRTVNALDYENLYISVRNRNSSLDEFLGVLEASL